MKKVVLSILVALSLLIIPNVKADDLPTITDHEKVRVYLFRGNGCAVCRSFITAFSEIYQDYADYFEIVAYETWENTENASLMYDVKEYFGEEANGSVPFIVIGSNFHSLGYNQNTVIEEALAAYQDESYTDIVAQFVEDGNYDVTLETFAEAAAAEEIAIANASSSESGLSDGAIVAIIFGILILGFGGLIIYSRKK